MVSNHNDVRLIILKSDQVPLNQEYGIISIYLIVMWLFKKIFSTGEHNEDEVMFK